MNSDPNDFDLDTDVGEMENQLMQQLRDWLPRRGDTLVEMTDSALCTDPCGYSDPRTPSMRSPIGRWDLYSDGYLLAADRLVDGLTGSPGEDELLYPILSLYRHHLELELKLRVFGCVNHGLSKLSEEQNAKVKEQLMKTHKLRDVWNTLKRCYPECERQFGQATRDAFEWLLSEYHDHDPDSQAARYPFDSKGNQTLPRLAFVDPRVFRKSVHKMSHYLRAIQKDMLQEVDWRKEMASW